MNRSAKRRSTQENIIESSTLYIGAILALTIFVLAAGKYVPNAEMQNNHPPEVHILSPADNSSYAWNTRVPYEISVSDPEDGESKYDEIVTSEILLEVKYLPGTQDIPAILNQEVMDDPPGMAALRTSNCASCHAFNAKLIGPSYEEIAKRYQNTRTNLDLLMKRVSEGSTGIWGNVQMPSHPELSGEEVRSMVSWILEKGGEPGVRYFTGTEGSFLLTPPADTEENGIFILTASYTDHGAPEDQKLKLKGQDRIVMKGR